jgi:hypothetical protein
MKINEKMKEWMVICIAASLALSCLFGMFSCMKDDLKERAINAKENPVEHAKDQCWSKVRGGRPACWSEGDWIEFCKHVQCKQ